MSGYQMVIGLETHIELSTKTKIFCACTTAFGGEPNTHCCPVCIGLPGSMPRLNRAVVEYAVRAGLATGCRINEIAKMDRKNYVYPDLPKAYQISQFDKPLCLGGRILLKNGREIGITRIHIEEDAGKLVHEGGKTYVDYNRGGVPLIEIVSEPDIRSVEEAVEYVEKLRLIMKYIGVSDVKMQEGSLRCDVNISLRRSEADPFGTRAEIKNMNSFAFMEKALRYEYERQAALLDAGHPVVQETRRFNTATGETEPMRGKEDAQDYRYFREPDLVTIRVTKEEQEALRKTLPLLPDERFARYTGELALPESDATLLTQYRAVSDYFDAVVQGLPNPKTAANFIIGQLFGRLATEEDKEAFAIELSPDKLRALCELVAGGKITMTLAKATLEKMLDQNAGPEEILTPEEMAGMDDSQLDAVCRAAVEANPAAVKDLRAGKGKAMGAIMGAVMKATKGRADAGAATAIIRKMIESMPD